ncbi:NADPH-dependent glutamate synthase small subunit [Photobacterium jeanii]|uniref:NADPH-dependent glutamate synthase small subunit n=1 Tax=Photobacterium jeanii TaxID=858640 RepID=A0A178K8K8_9GAMM|nr:NADPH-dependent glutamate synthase small subunit [Photobacterium jeanii]PST89180.1 NADPH-dependent glutamate synthase small subunit [Photobacterium jeanii]
MITITINGKLLEVEDNQTLLSIVRQHHIPLPSLCDSDNDSHGHSCELCDIEVAGIGIKKACQTTAVDGMTVMTESERLSQRRRNTLIRLLSEHKTEFCEPPCQTACPAKVDIQSYLAHIANNDHRKAIEVIKQALPMPLSIGRVCPAFCEAGCRRGLIDEPLAIRQLKRHTADIDMAAFESYVPEKAPDTGKSIAIVGSGPGGLTCGYYLSNKGYDVTVFESMPLAGGWLRYGIPEYRLPKAILDKEIDLMCRNGMAIQTNCTLGSDITLTALSEQYDAVCMAVGASKAVAMNYTGSELKGCYLGVDYLKDFVTDRHFTTGKKVAVIGGGNTAIDCARTAVRAGADTTLIYRRTRTEMPAEAYEIDEAEKEGVKFHFLTNPVENIANEDGWVSEVKMEIMKLGKPDSSGRSRPEPTGEYFTEEYDTVIAAVSQAPDLNFLEDDGIQLALTRWNTIDCNEANMYSGIDNIFGIGDFRRGPATAIEAIADGKTAAEAIDAFLNQGLANMATTSQNAFTLNKDSKQKYIHSTHLTDVTKVMRALAKGQTEQQQEVRFSDAMTHILRLSVPELTLEQRDKSFDEVEKGVTQQAASIEAQRCMACGCEHRNQCALRDYASQCDFTESELIKINRVEA